MPPRLAFALKLAAVAVGLAVLVFLPHFVSDFRSYQFARAGVFFVAILGLNILTGYTGQVSLGHGALMAVGAYTTAILVADHGMTDVWTIPIAGLVAAAAGFAIGVPALRLSGLYLAVVTFGLAVAMPSLLKKWSFTGGSGGINLFERALNRVTGALGTVSVLGHRFTQNDFFYYLAWGIGAVLLLAAWLLLRGRPGRAFRALRDSEIAASSSGINLAAYKTLAFAISGFYAGVAGSLFALISLNGFVNPQAFLFELSILILVGAVIGGLGSLGGVVFGALAVEFLSVGIDAIPNVHSLPHWVRANANAAGVPSVIYGTAIVLLMLVLPGGAAGLGRLVSSLTSRLYTRSQ
jgi:branched-chain amino acid transport system permease protein